GGCHCPDRGALGCDCFADPWSHHCFPIRNQPPSARAEPGSWYQTPAPDLTPPAQQVPPQPVPPALPDVAAMSGLVLTPHCPGWHCATVSPVYWNRNPSAFPRQTSPLCFCFPQPSLSILIYWPGAKWFCSVRCSSCSNCWI